MDRLLLSQIKAALKRDGQFVIHIDGDETPAIEKVRALGRRAGRELGWKVRTHATDPSRREDGQSVVYVVVIEASPLREQLAHIRARKAMSRLWEQIAPPPPPEEK